jgi:hypothetical protein
MAGEQGAGQQNRGHIQLVDNTTEGKQPAPPLIPPAAPAGGSPAATGGGPSLQGVPAPLQDFTKYQLHGQPIPNPPAPNVTADQLRQQIVNQRLDFRDYVRWFNQTYGGNVSP